MLLLSNIISIALASTATAAATNYAAVSDCFTIKGINPNGTTLGVLNVGNYWMFLYNVYGVFEDEINSFDGSRNVGTKLSIDKRTRHLVDRQPGDIWGPQLPHNGLVASVGEYSDFVWFDTKNTTIDPEGVNRVPLNCQVDSHNHLTCAHPSKPGFNKWYFCPVPPNSFDIWPTLRISTGDNIATAGWFSTPCYLITVTAARAQGCLS
ncbi:hypothetical protein LQW54_002044 [Pestalotiopsis sp. IQ-011]